jgi:hypothetical protein
MQISNIQENLSKTELIQRLQQIMQDAARASQGVQTARGEERSRIAQEEVETAQEGEQDRVREDGQGAKDAGQQRRKKKRQEPSESPKAAPKMDHRPLSGEGRIIDITV